MDNKFRISSKSNVNSVAGAIATALNTNKTVELLAVGAGAVNQACKSIAVARGFVAPQGKDLVCIAAFTEVEVDGLERTGLKFIVKEA